MPTALFSVKRVHLRLIGGSAVVKINVLIVLIRYSRIVLLQIKNAPQDPSAFPNVPIKKSICSIILCSSQQPSPLFPRTPIACASSI